jgi:hypothetical protein
MLYYIILCYIILYYIIYILYIFILQLCLLTIYSFTKSYGTIAQLALDGALCTPPKRESMALGVSIGFKENLQTSICFFPSSKMSKSLDRLKGKSAESPSKS